MSLACSSSSGSKDGSAGDGGGGKTGDGAAGQGVAGATGDASSADTSPGDASLADVAIDATPDAPGDGAVDGFAADAISADVVPTDSSASIVLTSTALSEGAAFAAANTCAGVNTSPPLTWSAGPAGTMSYAVILTDLSINAAHWVIWDIPSTTTSLAAALPGDTTLTTPAGAKQIHKLEFFGAGGAYRGPCPSGKNHIYQFEVNAIGAPTLAGVTGTSTVEAVKVAVQSASLAHGDLDGTSNATAPPADAGTADGDAGGQ